MYKRQGDEVLGYLWLIPGGTELSNSEYDKVEAAARTLELSLIHISEPTRPY